MYTGIYVILLFITYRVYLICVLITEIIKCFVSERLIDTSYLSCANAHLSRRVSRKYRNPKRKGRHASDTNPAWSKFWRSLNARYTSFVIELLVTSSKHAPLFYFSSPSDSHQWVH